MFCPKCGTENPADAKFCSKCGAALGTTSTPSGTSETSTGLSPNVAGLLCYVGFPLAWIGGIVFVLLEKKSKFVKFHAWQSIMTFGILMVVQIVISILAAIAWTPIGVVSGLWVFLNVLGIIVWVLIVGLAIALMILAYSGKMWKLPGVGNWAEKQASKAS